MPGWTLQQGQAVWKPTAKRPELAGELLMATNANGDYFVQFTKNPLPVATAERLKGRWQIIFGADKFSWRGCGEPPKRFVWFQLPRAMAGAPVTGHWQFRTMTTNSWRFENSHTGETLEGGFFP